MFGRVSFLWNELPTYGATYGAVGEFLVGCRYNLVLLKKIGLKILMGRNKSGEYEYFSIGFCHRNYLCLQKTLMRSIFRSYLQNSSKNDCVAVRALAPSVRGCSTILFSQSKLIFWPDAGLGWKNLPKNLPRLKPLEQKLPAFVHMYAMYTSADYWKLFIYQHCPFQDHRLPFFVFKLYTIYFVWELTEVHQGQFFQIVLVFWGFSRTKNIVLKNNAMLVISSSYVRPPL